MRMPALIMDGNDPWRSVSVASTGDQTIGIRVGNDADCQGSKNIEYHQPDEEAAGSAREILARVPHLAGGEDDELRAEVEGESRVDHCPQKGGETAPSTSNNVFFNRTRVIPVAEAKSIMAGTSTEHEDK